MSLLKSALIKKNIYIHLTYPNPHFCHIRDIIRLGNQGISTWHILGTYTLIIIYYTDSRTYYCSRPIILSEKYKDVRHRCILQVYWSVAIARIILLGKKVSKLYTSTLPCCTIVIHACASINASLLCGYNRTLIL